MVNRMRSTKGHTGNRRSHHALEEARLSLCECGAWHERHRVCQNCGKYRGVQVIDIVARTERESRRNTKREQTLRSMGIAGKEETTTAAEAHDHEGHEHALPKEQVHKETK